MAQYFVFIAFVSKYMHFTSIMYLFCIFLSQRWYIKISWCFVFVLSFHELMDLQSASSRACRPGFVRSTCSYPVASDGTCSTNAAAVSLKLNFLQHLESENPSLFTIDKWKSDRDQSYLPSESVHLISLFIWSVLPLLNNTVDWGSEIMHFRFHVSW